MRILAAFRAYGAEPPGGSAVYAERVVSLLRRAGHEVRVLLLRSGEGAAAEGVERVSVDEGLRGRVGAEVALRGRLARMRPDAVLLSGLDLPATGLPTWTLQAPLPPRRASGGALSSMRARLGRAGRSGGRSFVPTAAAQARWQANGDGSSPEVLHPGPGPEFGEARRAQAPSPEGPLRVVLLGALSSDRGVHVGVEALQGLPEGMRERVELLVVGQGSDPTYLGSLRRRAVGLEAAFIEQPLAARERAELLASAHLLLEPGPFEGTYGLALTEALAVGLPVVHTNTADLRELAGRAGSSVKAGDVKALGTATRALLQDRQAWGKAAASARSRFEELDLEAGADAVLRRLTGSP